MLQPKLASIESLPGCRLRLEYETGETKIFDVAPYITGSWYGSLKDEAYFKTVHVIDGGSGIAWADGQDIAPHELYESSESVDDAVPPKSCLPSPLLSPLP